MMRIILFLILYNFSYSYEIVNIVKINDETNKSAQRAPSLTYNNGVFYSSWIDFRNGNNGQVWFSKSTDFGATWSKNIMVYNSKIANSYYQRSSSISAFQDNVYLSWMASNGAHTDVFFVKSNNNGDSFEMPRLVSNDSLKYSQDFSAMHVDEDGNIHIVFIDNRNLQKHLVDHAEMMYTKSTDKGETWSDLIILDKLEDGNGGACECCWPAITSKKIDDKIQISVVYRSNIDDLRVFYIARSNDGGDSFEFPKRIGIEDWFISSCPVSGASICYGNNDELHIVYKIKEKLYYSKYSDNISANELLIGNGEKPNISFNEYFKTFSISYEKFIDNKSALVINKLVDGKIENYLTLSSGKDLTGFIDFVDVDNKTYVIWQDNSSGNDDIWFGELEQAIQNVDDNYKIEDGYLVLDLNLSSKNIMLFNILGESIPVEIVNNKINLQEIKNGQYILLIRNNEKTSIFKFIK